MSARLQRIHALLRAANVPSALSSRPGIGTVLHAGTPEHGPWDVLVRDTGSELLVHHSGGVLQLPAGATDTKVADAVKVHVVQAWADRGDPEAQALMAVLRDPSRPEHTAYRQHTSPAPQDVSPGAATALYVDPLLLAGQVFEAASRWGWSFFTAAPASTTFGVSGPWGTYRTSYNRR